MALIERADLRSAKCKVFQDDVNLWIRRAIITAHDQHYHDGSAWQDADEAVVTGTITGFVHKVDKLRHAIHLGATGTRRWMPRRNVPTEYIEFGRLQSWSGTAWGNVNLGTPTRNGNKLIFDTTNFKLSLIVTWRSVKIEVVLKTENARRRLRWSVTLNGLTYNNGVLTAVSDGAVVGYVERPIAWDANGSIDDQNVTITTTYSGGFIEFGGDLSAAVLPITIDPTLSLQPDATDGIDTYLVSDFPDNNYATNAGLFIGERNDQTSTRRSLIVFDLSGLDGTETLDTVTLSLYASEDKSSNARTFRVYRLKRAWVEAQATWNIYSTSNNWSTAGGFHADDCEQTEIGSRDFTATETLNQFKDFILTPTSKATLDLGYGWLLKADTETDDAYVFASSDNTTAANRPKLVVNYTEAAAGGKPWYAYAQQ